MSSAAATACSTVEAGAPEGTGTPWRAKSCLPWYSRRSMRAATLALARLGLLGLARRVQVAQLAGAVARRQLSRSRSAFLRRLCDRLADADEVHGQREDDRR